jgi:hypothetical protein
MPDTPSPRSPAWVRDHEQDKKAGEARLALVRRLVTAYGYGVLAAGAGGPILDPGGVFPKLNMVLLGLGLALHAVAIYLAPVGTDAKDD